MKYCLETLVENDVLTADTMVKVVLEDGTLVYKGLAENLSEFGKDYELVRFLKEGKDKFNSEDETIEVKSKKPEKVEKSDESPISREDTLKSIKYFNLYKPEVEEAKAKEIVYAMHKYGISSDIIEKDNKLLKYIDSCTADIPSSKKVEEKSSDKEDEEKLIECLATELLDDSDESILSESLNVMERRRWRIIKNTMKFVDKDSVRKAYPELKDSSDKNIVRQLKYMLEKLPEEKKMELINNHVAKELEAKTLGIGKGHTIAGNTVGSVGGVSAGVGGVVGTQLFVGSLFDGTLGGTIAGIILGPLAIVGGLALTALATAGVIGISTAVGSHNTRKAQRKYATMMNKQEIIKALKKYAKPEEKKEITQHAVKLALAENNIPGHHICKNCGGNLDAWDHGDFCDSDCKAEYDKKLQKEKEEVKPVENKEESKEINEAHRDDPEVVELSHEIKDATERLNDLGINTKHMVNKEYVDELCIKDPLPDQLTEASSAEKRAFKHGGKDSADLVQGKAIARIKDSKARDAAVAAVKANRSEVAKDFYGQRKEDQADRALDKKMASMEKAGYAKDEDTYIE